MSRHDCRQAVGASSREIICREHNTAYVPKVEAFAYEARGVEGTVKVCPACVAAARAQVRKMKALNPHRAQAGE